VNLEKIATVRCFGGEQRRYQHVSTALSCTMRFSVFLPPVALQEGFSGKLPVLYWLSGLTCNDENFVQKAGAQRVAAELGLVLVTPDTSPRGEGVAAAPDGAWDIGLSAGFYLNATQAPWRLHYRMYEYIVDELPALVEAQLPVSAVARAISGHSMGGHGALVIALRNPDRFRSVSVFAPIVAPAACPWGQKAFSHYLGEDQAQWAQYDATSLIARSNPRLPLLYDQGGADQYLEEQLLPGRFLEAAAKASYPIDYRERTGYDHGYCYIATFIEEHLRFHAAHLAKFL